MRDRDATLEAHADDLRELLQRLLKDEIVTIDATVFRRSKTWRRIALLGLRNLGFIEYLDSESIAIPDDEVAQVKQIVASDDALVSLEAAVRNAAVEVPATEMTTPAVAEVLTPEVTQERILRYLVAACECLIEVRGKVDALTAKGDALTAKVDALTTRLDEGIDA